MNFYDQNFEDYVAGFNDATLIAEYAPEILAESPTLSDQMDNYAKGFGDGKDYIVKEQEQADLRVIEEMESIRKSSRELDNELEL